MYDDEDMERMTHLEIILAMTLYRLYAGIYHIGAKTPQNMAFVMKKTPLMMKRVEMISIGCSVRPQTFLIVNIVFSIC